MVTTVPIRDDKELLEFVAGIAGEDFLKVEEDLGGGFVRLKVSEAERRQAKHDIRSVEDIIVELMRNARDAAAHTIFVATTSEGGVRHLTILDDGCGVPDALRDLIFQPRVTSKLETMVVDEWGVHGRGMALYSISQNVDRCELVETGPNLGSSLVVQVASNRLPERADQSTWPKVRVAGGSTTAFSVESGPKNIVRHVVEFAVAHPEIDVYFGSPSEVLATTRALAAPGSAHVTPKPTLYSKTGIALGASDLRDVALELGLPVSDRTAQRVVAGEIRPLPTVLERLASNAKTDPAAIDIYRDTRGLKIAPSDLAQLQSEVERAFESLAEKYYLALGDSVKVTVGRRAITVTVAYEKE